MPAWQSLAKRFWVHPLTQLSWRGVRRVGKASESAVSFGLVAFAGVVGLVWMNIQPPAYSPIAEPEVLSTLASKAELGEEAPAEPAFIQKQEAFSLRRGETLITLLRRATIDNANAHSVVNQLKDITNLRRLLPGQEVRLIRQRIDGRKIKEIRIRDSFQEEALVTFTDGRYRASRPAIETYALTHLVSGEITDSLYLSAKRSGLPDKVIIDLIRMMTFDVDFEREIRVGDTFEVYFERNYSPHFNDIENGRILRAKLTLRKRTLDAYFFRDAEGEEGYYDSKGISTRRALMKTPLDVAVLTSSFGRRKHPVLGYTRAHKGSDFRAPTGTPIMAAGDGVIEMSARNGSYGNYIRIRHNNTYKTAYAHLSRYGKGIKKGRRVKQGQIIGYSGATGRVTGAHLHYEVLVNKRQVNPMTVILPTGKRLIGKALTNFQSLQDRVLTDIKWVSTQRKIILETASIKAEESNGDRPSQKTK